MGNLKQNDIDIIKVTNTALEELRRIKQKENKNLEGVRISLLAGGCSGLSYNLEFDNARENDSIKDYGDIKIFIDPKSTLYLYGMTLDYHDDLNSKGFVFDNPNAKKTCGCGTSFSPGDKEISLQFKQNTNPNICKQKE